MARGFFHLPPLIEKFLLSSEIFPSCECRLKMCVCEIAAPVLSAITLPCGCCYTQNERLLKLTLAYYLQLLMQLSLNFMCDLNLQEEIHRQFSRLLTCFCSIHCIQLSETPINSREVQHWLLKVLQYRLSLLTIASVQVLRKKYSIALSCCI